MTLDELKEQLQQDLLTYFDGYPMDLASFNNANKWPIRVWFFFQGLWTILFVQVRHALNNLTAITIYFSMENQEPQKSRKNSTKTI